MFKEMVGVLNTMEANLDAAIRASYGGLRDQVDQNGADIWEVTERLIKLENSVAALMRLNKERING